jgi:hypothetical protein
VTNKFTIIAVNMVTPKVAATVLKNSSRGRFVKHLSRNQAYLKLFLSIDFCLTNWPQLSCNMRWEFVTIIAMNLNAPMLLKSDLDVQQTRTKLKAMTVLNLVAANLEFWFNKSVQKELFWRLFMNY